MKKFRFYLIFLMSFVSIQCFCQQTAYFRLLPDGTFTSTDGQSYIVLPYEGQNAITLYEMVRNNIFKLYKEPSSVLRENPYQSIKVHGYIDLGKKPIVLIPRNFGGYFNLLFQFKEGRIRIDAPTMDNELICTDGTLKDSYKVFFDDFAKGLFKNGQPKPKTKDQIDKIEMTLNSIIYYCLGLLNDNKNNDW